MNKGKKKYKSGDIIKLKGLEEVGDNMQDAKLALDVAFVKKREALEALTSATIICDEAVKNNGKAHRLFWVEVRMSNKDLRDVNLSYDHIKKELVVV